MRLCVLALLLASCVSGTQPGPVEPDIEPAAEPGPDAGSEPTPDLAPDLTPDLVDTRGRFCGPEVEMCPMFTYKELACTNAAGNQIYDGCGRQCWLCGNSGRTLGCTSDLLPGVICTWKCKC